MATFKAIEMSLSKGEPTGRVELYTARNVKAAAKKVLYTRRLKSGRCKLGPTGRVVNCGDKVWVVKSGGPKKVR